MGAGVRLAVPHQGEPVPLRLPLPFHVPVSPAEEQDRESVLVTQEGHVIAEESQIHPLIFIAL